MNISLNKLHLYTFTLRIEYPVHAEIEKIYKDLTMDFSNIFKCKLPVINPKERGIGVGVHLQLVGFING